MNGTGTQRDREDLKHNSGAQNTALAKKFMFGLAYPSISIHVFYYKDLCNITLQYITLTS